MKLPTPLHDWDLSPKQAVALQRKLANKVRRSPGGELNLSRIRRVAGLDAAFSADKGSCIAGVVLWDVPEQKVIEQRVVRRPLRFPYVPGLLSFREAPALLAALGELRGQPDALLCDGQGIAHPRRFGLAAHVGLLADLPAVGCAKSRLIGEHRMPGPAKGDWATLTAGEEQIGAVLRTRDRVKPLYISIGHGVDLELALALTLRCCSRYRLPEPTRLADKLVAHSKSQAAVEGHASQAC